ncbi:hypothetical protein V502_03616 [Pseudogymnoascus sp. VKM F-4520 (FW-2644)]|nr:hypothetical protein V502_03616 [Pseudogymnoascus sp. VKM F-4520 (FW-2644)]
MELGSATMVSSVLGKRSRMRTYANRVRKDTADSPAKRVFIEAVKPLQDITNVLSVAPPPVAKSKKSITDYFTKPPPSANPSSSATNPSSNQSQEHLHSSPPPSSPLPLEPSHTGTKPPSRKRRRLTTRPRAIKPTRTQATKPDKMATPEDYDGHVSDSDLSTSSDASSWESSIIDEYAANQRAMDRAALSEPSMGPRGYRSNTFESSPAVGSNDTGRARAYTMAGGELMLGEFSDMTYPNNIYFSEVLYIRASNTLPNGVSKDRGRSWSNTTSVRDAEAEKAFPIPAYSDSSSKMEATPAKSSCGANEGGQKENIKPGKLVQTQINLGQNPITTCNVCKFTLNRTVTEDVKAHDKFHQAFVNLADKLDGEF